jgi:hypothetical protein
VSETPPAVRQEEEGETELILFLLPERSQITTDGENRPPQNQPARTRKAPGPASRLVHRLTLPLSCSENSQSFAFCY